MHSTDEFLSCCPVELRHDPIVQLAAQLALRESQFDPKELDPRSLAVTLTSTPSDLTRFSSLLELVSDCRETKPVFALALAAILHEATKAGGQSPQLFESAFWVGRTAIEINLRLSDIAIPTLQLALTWYQSNPHDIARTIKILELLAKAYRNSGDYRNALSTYQEAILKSTEHKLFSRVAFQEYMLGKMYANYLKQPMRGLTQIERATEILVEGGKGIDLKEKNDLNAMFLDESGNLLRQLGELRKALVRFQEALDINSDVENIGGKGRNLCHIGLAYWDLGERDKALELFNRGTLLTKSAGNQERGLGLRLGQLGYMIGLSGNPPEGSAMVSQAIKINMMFHDYRIQAGNLIRQAELYMLQKDKDKCLRHLELSLQLAEQRHYTDIAIDAHLKLGQAQCELARDYREGYIHYSQAYKLHRGTWRNLLDEVPQLEPTREPATISLMYTSLFNQYQSESSSMIEQLNKALKDSLESEVEAERAVLVSSVHRLRTPLMSLRNHLDLIYHRGRGSTYRMRAKWLESAREALAEMEEILDGFLEIASGLQSSHERFSPIPFLRDVIKRVLDKFPDVNVIEGKLDKSILECRGARRALETAVTAILTNACEAVAIGGIINVSLASQRAQADEPGRLRVEISDSGPGVSPEHGTRIFELRFTTKPHGKGLGLNLALKAIKAEGGEIGYGKGPERGAVFWVNLPVYETR